MASHNEDLTTGSRDHLFVSRFSDDFASSPSSAQSFSDYYDDSSIEHAYYEKYPSSTRRRHAFKTFICSLTYSPLGLARRKSRSRKTRVLYCVFNFIVLTITACLVFSVADAIFRPSYNNPPKHYRALQARVHASQEPGRGNPRNEKIFIASNIIQPELIRGAWGESILRLIDFLGPQNVFVSIYENDSGPDTILALSWLRAQLKCEYNIVFGDHISLDSFPTVVLPNGEPRVKRITYLAEVRNKLLRPLDEPPAAHLKETISLDTPAINYTSTRFDRVLFVNDIYFRPEDALNLLFSTNLNQATGISEYQAACSMDFIRGGTLYDSFVIRDVDGHEITWFLYPWFSTQGTGATRKDVLAQKDAVRVRSCWSGMAAYEGTPFLRKAVVDANPSPPHLIIPSDLSNNSSQSHHLEMKQDYSPLRFRSQSDIFWEASECCLLNADLLARYPGISTQMFLNPYIRVSYDHGTWIWQPVIQRFERFFTILEWIGDKIRLEQTENPRIDQVIGRPTSTWKWIYDNPALNGEQIRNSTEDRSNGLSFPLSKDQMTGSWQQIQEVASPGAFCGIQRTFVMLNDLQKANRGNTGKNWEKIDIPKFKQP